MLIALNMNSSAIKNEVLANTVSCILAIQSDKQVSNDLNCNEVTPQMNDILLPSLAKKKLL